MTETLKKEIKKNYPDAEILKVGKWDWVYFNKKPEKELREKMKKGKGYWNAKRNCWQFNNGHYSKNSPYPAKILFLKYGVEEEEIKI